MGVNNWQLSNPPGLKNYCEYFEYCNLCFSL